ncbi:hypothetical protein NP233_g3818 [Leucocoprinus birnbaumii]|uniref:Copper transport protein n=1 Tax=Leucocoprinus birnbaumii TaxID=56174 RepID=A0AAD5VVV9_9AGAR|nr:hypothetical protein NP233_g3818 [Leucocoprinus birnbaumii]
MDMNMSSSNGSDGSMMVMMTPFFHFVGGDYLLFQEWKPTSGGAIAGACVGLFIFALFERWVNGISPAIEDHLKHRSIHHVAVFCEVNLSGVCRALQKIPTKAISGGKDLTSRRSSSESAEPPSAPRKQGSLPTRTIPPFIPSVDITRGVLYAFRRILGFGLMLAVM